MSEEAISTSKKIEFTFQNNVTECVIPFYYPNRADVWHDRLQSGVFANFYLMPDADRWLTVSLGGVAARFRTSEAAYQAMKWWYDDEARAEFEACEDGQTAFDVKLRRERTSAPDASWSNVGDGLGALLGAPHVASESRTSHRRRPNKWHAMEFVLREKFARPEFRRALLASGSALLLEHCELEGRDLFWSDNQIGNGQNRLGRMLMLLRRELDAALWPRGLVKRALFVFDRRHCWTELRCCL